MEKETKEQQQLHLFLESPFYHELKKVARYRGLSLSSFVRLTLRNELDQQEKKQERHEKQAA